LLVLEAIVNHFRLAYIDKPHFIRYIHGESLTGALYTKVIEDLLRANKYAEMFYDAVPMKIDLTVYQKLILNHKHASLCFWQIGYGCYLKLGDRAMAKEYFLKGLKLDPLNVKFWKTYFIKIVLNT
jgi:hypothetical protein